MKLHIYGKIDGKKAVIKTYTAETYDLLWGTCEDVAGALDLDQLATGSDTEIMRLAMNLVLHSLGTVKTLFLDIFEGLTEEELRGATVKEMAQVLVDVVRYTLATLSLYAPKNQ